MDGVGLIKLILYAIRICNLFFRIICYLEIGSVSEMTLVFWMKGVTTKENSRMTNRCPWICKIRKCYWFVISMVAFLKKRYQSTKIIQWKIIRIEAYELQDLRPEIPGDTHPKLVELLHRCWHKDPSLRPDFSEIMIFLQHVTKTVWVMIDLSLPITIVFFNLLQCYLMISKQVAGKKKVKVKAKGNAWQVDNIWPSTATWWKPESTCTHVKKKNEMN